MSCLIQFNRACIHGINTLNEWIGRSVSWLTLMMVLATFLIVVLRYVFNIGSVPLQESVSYMHTLVFMLGAAYTLKNDGHVRVDIFYQRFSPTAQAWVDCLGVLLLLMPGRRIHALDQLGLYRRRLGDPGKFRQFGRTPRRLFS